MKLSSLLCILALLVGFASCSGSKSTQEVEEVDAGIELSDAEEFVEQEGTDAVAENLAGDLGFQEPVTAEQTPVLGADSLQAPASSEQVAIIGAEVGEYTVQKNETLMMIAFKIYGDYARWREIANANTDKLDTTYMLKPGTVLSYNRPTEEFKWTPTGNPYLIKQNDTLGIISKDTYGVQKYWKNIWDNNKPLIKDPNRIFAGFTIYTPEIEARSLANE